MLLQFGPALTSARVDRLARGAGVPLSSAYRYLTLLREAGLVRVQPEGTRRMLQLRRDDLDRRFPGFLDSIVACATP